MNYFSAETKIEYLSDIPEAIHHGLLKLFEVDALSDLSKTSKEQIRRSITQLFANRLPTNYDDYRKAYALYYLPVNLQKVWRPLLDLVITDSLPAKCSLLELGAGPGSSTFGFTEFYHWLACDNPDKKFSITITIIERDSGFIDIFRNLWDDYKATLPDNLNVSISWRCDDAISFLLHCEENKFDFVIESNMLNPNEHIEESQMEILARQIKTTLKRHGSTVFIEPAKQNLSHYLKSLKKALLQNGMNCYSPCFCDNPECAQFASAQLNTSKISICKELYDAGIISKPAEYHAFEYAVFRKDGLRKYDTHATERILSDLRFHDGELISFKAFVLAIAHPDEEIFALKLCDGTMSDKQTVWLNIPKQKLLEKDINSLTCGRGGLVDVKNAVVEGENKLGFCAKTRLRIYR